MAARGQVHARVVARLQQAQCGAQERQEEEQPSAAGHAAHAGHQQGGRRDTDGQQDGSGDEALPSPRRPDIPRDCRHGPAPA